VQKAHAFVGHPPKGTLTLTRKNGDILYYDPKGNVFAVASKEGAPRTMFKPDDGMAYWDKQKDREERSQQASHSRRSKYADDAE
jgi:pyocin large subunit-like protein